MEQKLSHYGERGTWAPLVGVALAALTIGSLILFSVIAQRTAGGAFVSNGVIARSPVQQAARSITLATGAGGGGSAAASERTAAELPGAPSPTPELVAVESGTTADAAPLATAADPGPAASDDDAGAGATVATTDDLRPFFRMTAGGPDNGQVFAASRGKNANGEGKAKKNSKDRKDAKGKGSKDKDSKRKGSKDRKATGRSHPGNNHGSEGHRRRSGGVGQSRAAAPARSSRPAASSRPAPKAKPASNHPNQRGKGHSKGRGRGHRH